MRPILLGQAPSKTSSRLAEPFAPDSSSGRRLASLLGVNPCNVRQLLDLRNLLPGGRAHHRGNGHGSPDGRRRHGGDHFPWAKARRAAEVLWDDVALPPGGPYPELPRIIFAGHKVAECFGRFSQRSTAVLQLRLLDWRGRFALVGTLPHPSGVNHFYNDPERRGRAAAFLRSESGVTELEKAAAKLLARARRASRRS